MGGQLVTPVVEVLVRGDVDRQRSQFRRKRLIDLSEHLTELGALLYDEPSRRVKPKRLLRALLRSPFAALAREAAAGLPTAPVTAREAERVLFPRLNEWTSRELVARPDESAARAERLFDSLPLDAPLLLTANLPHTQAERAATFADAS